MMAKELLMLTGLFYFASTLPESNTMAISSSSRDFDLSASNVAYDRSRGKDTEIATTPALKDITNTAITPLQATKQLTTTIVTQNSNDNEFVLTAVGSQPFFSLSTCLPSRTRTTTMTTQVQAGNLLSNSSSTFFHRAFTKNGHDYAVSSTFPSSDIYSGPEITLATSRLSGVITANTFTKAKMNAATNTKTRDAFDTVSREQFPISISFNSMGKKIASSSQLQTAQLSSPSILVEISVFEHDTSISTPDGNKMFTKGSGRFTNSPSNVLVGSTIWDGLNLTPNATSYSNVALSRMSRTAISSKNTSSVGEVSQASIESSFPDISGISQTGMKGAEITHTLDTEFYSSRTLYTTSSFVVAGTSPQTSPNSSLNRRQFSLSTEKTRAFSTFIMASPEVASKTQTFSSRTTETISMALMSASGSDTSKKDSSIKVTSESDTVMKSSALEAKRLSSRVNTTSYLRSNSATISVKESLTTSGKVSSIQKGNSTTEITSAPVLKSLTTQEALVPSETTNHFTTATPSLSRSSETYFISTQMSFQTNPQVSTSTVKSIAWLSTSSRFSASEISPSDSTTHFSAPVSQIVTGTESQTNQHQETMHLRSSKTTSAGQPLFISSSKIKSFSVRPPSIDISSTRLDPGIRLSSSQGSTATEHPLTSSYSQVKSHWKVSPLDNKTRLQSQLPPSVTIPMVTSTLDSGKLNVSSSAAVVPRRTQVTSKVLPPGLTSHKPPTIQVQPTPSTTSSATIAGNISTENPPTTVSDSNTGHVKLLVVVAIVPSVILCVLFAAVLWFRRHRRQQKFPSYSIKVEYLDEKKFRKRCVNSRLDLSLKGIHIDLEFPSERRDSYPRDIALFSRGSNVCERDRESPETEDELEWSNEVIVRVTETSLNSRTQPAGRDSVYSVKEKENFESSEKVVRRESSKRGRETVKWRIPVVQRRDSEEFDQRYSLGTDVTALFLEEPQEEQQSDNSTSKDSPKITQLLCDQSEHDKGDDTSRLDVKDLQVQLPNKKLEDHDHDNQVKKNKENDSKETKLTCESNSRKEESSQHVQNTSPPRPRFGTL